MIKLILSQDWPDVSVCSLALILLISSAKPPKALPTIDTEVSSFLLLFFILSIHFSGDVLKYTENNSNDDLNTQMESINYFLGEVH